MWINSAIRTLCLALLTFALLWLIRDTDRGLRAITATANSLAGLPQTVQPVLSHIVTITDDLHGVIAAESKAQASQLRESQKIMAATKEVLVRTDCQLNGGPGCLGVLPNATQLLSRTAVSLETTSSRAQETLQRTSQTLDSLNQRIQDPRLDSILTSFQVSALQFEGISSNGNLISADLATYVHRLTKPQSKFHQALSLAPAAIKIGAGFIP